MPEWDEGLLDFDYDPSTGDLSSTMDPASIGSAYYNMNAEDPLGTSMFWYDLLQEFLPSTVPDDFYVHHGNTVISNSFFENNPLTTSLGNYEGFMNMYGEYLPQDFGLGQSRIARGKRLNRAGVGVLHGDSMSEAANLRTKYGKSGFASSGMQSKTGQDIWKKYIGSAKGRQENMREMEHGVHAEFGQSILDTLQSMAQDSASGQFFVGPQGEGSTWQSNWYTGDPQEDFLTGSGTINLQGTEWTQAIFDYCSNPDNVGQDYYAMCDEWAWAPFDD